MVDVTDPVRAPTVTEGESKAEVIGIKGLLARDEDFVRAAVAALVEAALEAEMTELFERYRGSERAPVGALAEMCVQGVATRKVKGVTEALCGHSFSASSISAINKSPDQSFKAVAERRLSESDPDLIPDAGYEGAARRVSLSAGRCWWRSRLIEGRRRMLAVALANRESRSSRREFLLGFTVRGLTGVEFAMSDDRPGLKQAIGEVLPETVWQRCCAPLLPNALDHAPRKVDDDCLRDLR